MNQTISIYASVNCPRAWIINAVDRNLTLGKIVNHYYSGDSMDVENLLDPILSSNYRKIQFQSDEKAMHAFKNERGAKVAVGVTKSESLDLACPSVLLDVPTYLVLEGADVSSLAVLLAQNLSESFKTRKNFSSLNVVILECFEKDFVQTLKHHASGQKFQLTELDCFANFEEEMSRLGTSSTVIVRHCNTKTATFVKNQIEVPIVNVHPVRTIQEGIGYVNKFPFKSSLYLWTDSVSILFSTWKKLDFANVYANSVRPTNEKLVYLNGANVSGSFMHTILTVPPLMFSGKKPVEVKKAMYIYEIVLKNKGSSVKDTHKKILQCFPTWKLREFKDLLSWAESEPCSQIITECKPKEKLTVGVYVNDLTEVLPTFLFAMSVCGWEKLVVFAPEEIKVSEGLNLQVSQLRSVGDSSTYHLVFTPNGLLNVQDVDEERFEGCKRRYGILTGVELAKHVVFESSLVKHVQIPFNFITT